MPPISEVIRLPNGDFGIEYADGTNKVTSVENILSASEKTAVQALVSGAGNTYVRWCIPGKDTSGTLFKDVSGRGNDATIDASNSGPFAVDSRISTIVHASAGGTGRQPAGARWRRPSRRAWPAEFHGCGHHAQRGEQHRLPAPDQRHL